RVRGDERFEAIEAPVDLASVCFRYLPAWARPLTRAERSRPALRERLNGLQKSIQQEIERRGFAWFPTIVLRGEVHFRFGVFNYRTTEKDVDAVLDHIVKVAASRGGRAAPRRRR
ncbi:MAG TPA: hypothetical protein VGA64_06620, partial [Candidatus Polarisedimenticolia bacterium]